MNQSINFYLSLIIFFITYFFIITEKIHRTVIVLIGASLMMFVKIIYSDKAFGYIDWNVIVLLIGMMLVVSMIKKIGLLEWIAIKTAKLVKGKPLLLMILMMWITAVISAFLDNVTTVLLIAPVVILISVQLKLSPIPFLITQVIASNIGGTATLIGDPPNLLIGSASENSFLDFVLNLTLPVFIIMVFTSLIVYFVFQKKMNVSKELRAEIMGYDDTRIITDKKKLIKALIIFTLIVIGFVLHGILHFEPYLMAISGAFILIYLLKADPDELLAEVEWTTLFFFAGLFIIIGGLQESGVIDLIALNIIKLSGNNMFLLTSLILFLSILLAALIGNIPYVMTMIPIIKQIGPEALKYSNLPDYDALWWALALGACLGGNGTLIGASANVVVAGFAEKNGYKITFKRFMKYGAPITVISFIVSWIYLYFKYFF